MSLYLKNKLGYSEKNATLIFHGYTCLAYFLTISGSLLSDDLLGKFKTIYILSIVYAVGSVVVAISAIPLLGSSAKAILNVGLVLICLGCGGIKPCVSAFGGDQFKLPEQAEQIVTFFSVFYMSINLGALISTTTTPLLRANVHCFGQNDCYPLAFSVPAILMILAIGKLCSNYYFFQTFQTYSMQYQNIF